ncbi:unnamed protein product [Notodromas monacha]|uniref:Inositol oxygenase n=1 Tax=Notodromas monacha TaxID=399045 RepID=A0A7R9BHN3_9CRUS|nr:unnamed protein product [Notodromas monacha]CAG0914845.1 unnamed protein product [Notodromas monacha]
MRIVPASVDFNEKDSTTFRNYGTGDTPSEIRVRETYEKLHTYQTVDFVKGRIAKWGKFDHFKASVMDTLERLSTFLDETDPDMDLPNIIHAFQTAERIREKHPDMDWFHLTGLIHDLEIAKWGKFDHFKASVMDTLERLSTFLDETDPDMDLPNIIHAFQTAERIREKHPDMDWFHLTGLIHDLGKIMAFYGEPQWAVAGDTHPVGCEFAKSIVYRERTFDANPDLHDSRYNSKYGVYQPNCGLRNVTMTWGHDEYMFRILEHNKCSLPPEALFHSFYPWHTGGDYMHLCDEYDLKMLPMVQAFQ